jgi:alkylation response protein AidB-like acyl-CoA dehydrogenase
MDESVRDMLRTTAQKFIGARVPFESVSSQADQPETRLDRQLWREMAELGWTSLGLPEAVGGAQLALADRVILFEEMGKALYSGPFFSCVGLAARCLEGDQAAVDRLASGASVFTLAWSEPDGAIHLLDTTEVSTVAEPTSDGFIVSGVKTGVIDAEIADEVVVTARTANGVGLFLLNLSSDGVSLSPEHSIDGTRRRSLVAFDAAPAQLLVGPDETLSVIRRIRAEALVSLSYEALGVAEVVLRDSAQYATNRQQFGKAIGSFQAVAGPLAERYVDVELARALADWAVVALDRRDQDADVAVAAAKASCAEAAVRTVETAIQVAGAIGFTWEHHYHRYLRRSLWIDHFEGGAVAQRSIVAATLLDRRSTPKVVEFYDDERAIDFRAEVRTWINSAFPTERRGIELVSSLEEYEAIKLRWQHAMNETGLLVAHWPTELGGRSAPPLHTAIFREEAIKAHPRVSHGDAGSDLVAPLLMEYGTADQKARFLEPIRLETQVWAQGFSEPDSGSDLASLTTKAQPRGDHWILNGSKTWSTYSPVADWLFVLARTDPDASRHRGITCFIVDARAPGVEIRPIRDIAGTDEFGEVFLTDVDVPASDVLGPVNEGWSVAVMTLAIERVIESCEDIGELGFIFDRLVDCLCDGPVTQAEDGFVRDSVARLWCQLQAVRLVQYRCLLALDESGVPPSESEILKLAWSEVTQKVARLGLDLFGPFDATSAQASIVARFWEFWYMMSRSVTIYAGTSEILRSVIAERILRLPRSR